MFLWYLSTVNFVCHRKRLCRFHPILYLLYMHMYIYISFSACTYILLVCMEESTNVLNIETKQRKDVSTKKIKIVIWCHSKSNNKILNFFAHMQSDFILLLYYYLIMYKTIWNCYKSLTATNDIEIVIYGMNNIVLIRIYIFIVRKKCVKKIK